MPMIAGEEKLESAYQRTWIINIEILLPAGKGIKTFLWRFFPRGRGETEVNY